ncbi:hypothetical protein BC628DRAFT_190679 [Trametes gibbosa]|nr:hypothetical protein BC628DRAFT_190679 [Trametes gibbosa]
MGMRMLYAPYTSECGNDQPSCLPGPSSPRLLEFTARLRTSSFNPSSRCPSLSPSRALPGGWRVSRSHSFTHAGRNCLEKLQASSLSPTQCLPGIDHNSRHISRSNGASPSPRLKAASRVESSGKCKTLSSSRSMLRWSAVAVLFLLSAPSVPCAQAGVVLAPIRRDLGHTPSVSLPSVVSETGAYPYIPRWRRQAETSTASSSGGSSAQTSTSAAEGSGSVLSGTLGAGSDPASQSTSALMSPATPPLSASASRSDSGSLSAPTGIPSTSVSLPISLPTSLPQETLSSLTSLSLPTAASISSLSFPSSSLSLSLPSSSSQSRATITRASSASTSAASRPSSSAASSSLSATNASSNSAPLNTLSQSASSSSSSESTVRGMNSS